MQHFPLICRRFINLKETIDYMLLGDIQAILRWFAFVVKNMSVDAEQLRYGLPLQLRERV